MQSAKNTAKNTAKKRKKLMAPICISYLRNLTVKQARLHEGNKMQKMKKCSVVCEVRSATKMKKSRKKDAKLRMPGSIYAQSSMC